jgi:hypothetical protein
VQQFEAWLAALDQGAEAEGFITAVHTAASKAQQQQQQGEGAKGDAGDGSKGLVYQEYNPLKLLGGKAGGEVLPFTSFDDALDEYYGKVSSLCSLINAHVESMAVGSYHAHLSMIDDCKPRLHTALCAMQACTVFERPNP